MSGEKRHASVDEQVLFGPKFAVRTLQRLMRALPSNPRCKICYSPFAGIGGRIVGVAGFKPSRKNPEMCTGCFEKAPIGGEEMDIGVLFADVRGFTPMSETTPPEEMAALLNRFYGAASDALVHRSAVIDKMVGDQVMALFIPWFMDSPVERMCDAADDLLKAVGFGGEAEPWLPLGVGMDFGRAFVGNVGVGEVKDFTAIGDVVNTAARLQAEASAGQMVLSDNVFGMVPERYRDARAVELQLKGKAEPVAAHVVDTARVLSPA
jgi:adenylate cyclase